MNVRAAEPITVDDVRIGSYSLETLTTGMYEDPLHCVREYIQNAYDAIRAARSDGTLPADGGLVTVAVSGSASRPTLSIRDNGTGISSADAIGTLVSIGASRKRPNINAGFRGIGRLAGVAYCATLRFTTSFKGEPIATVVEFDCGKLRGYMRPGVDAQDVREVIRLCVLTGNVPAKEEDHFTEVEMVGLTGIGLEFAEVPRLIPYLRQVCPVDYSDRFQQAARIRAYSDSLGYAIGAIEVEIRYKRERTQILKAYDDSSPTSQKPSIVSGVEFIDSAELGWHGWLGVSNFNGEITDGMVAGPRFRVKNIQVGGSEIIEELGAELTLGGTEGRLQRWAVGEIFITNPAVVPNARRDGFEDSTAWRDIRKDIKLRVAKRVVTLVRTASKTRSKMKSLALEITSIASSVGRPDIDEATISRLLKQIDRVMEKLRPEKLPGVDPNELGELVSRLKAVKERLLEIRSRPPKDSAGGEGAGGGQQQGDNPQGDATSSGDTKGQGESGNAGASQGGTETRQGRQWSAEELLAALRSVLVRELGQDEADRLYEIALEKLNSE
ncbi:ATP-binding protein [Lacibacterium aquatile]|uniref:ATP-binding protein n=1 Tax=Lacibacterium aquatile TaxID=1168082 RepID=A0ABW5DPY1_9PROT